MRRGRERETRNWKKCWCGNTAVIWAVWKKRCWRSGKRVNCPRMPFLLYWSGGIHTIGGLTPPKKTRRGCPRSRASTTSRSTTGSSTRGSATGAPPTTWDSLSSKASEAPPLMLPPPPPPSISMLHQLSKHSLLPFYVRLRRLRLFWHL